MKKILLGRCIHVSPGGVRVHQNFFYRWLCFSKSNAIQSAINRRRPEKPVLRYITTLCALARSHPGSTCMLGVGGLAAAHYLSSGMNDFKMVAIDINAEVIDIARRYFMADHLKQLSIVHEDAKVYIKDIDQQFKHIIVDLYQQSSFPEDCKSEAFFNDCYERLETNGFLGVNLANPEERLDVFIMIQKQFGQSTVVIPVKGCANMIILACKTPSFSYLTEQLSNALKIKYLTWDPVWGCIAELL